MAGRRGKPLQLHLLDGKSRLTKDEIRFRSENEIHIGNNNFIITKMVEKNSVAKEKWNEIIQLYLECAADFVSSADIGIIERYCLTYSEYVDLQKARDEIKWQERDAVKTARALYDLGIEDSINKKIDILTKLEDRLFLNPLAKVRNIPKKEKKTSKEDPAKQMFGD